MLEFLGQLIAIALRTKNLLPLDFPPFVWKAPGNPNPDPTLTPDHKFDPSETFKIHPTLTLIVTPILVQVSCECPLELSLSLSLSLHPSPSISLRIRLSLLLR